MPDIPVPALTVPTPAPPFCSHNKQNGQIQLNRRGRPALAGIFWSAKTRRHRRIVSNDSSARRSADSEPDLRARDEGIDPAAHRSAERSSGNPATCRGREALVDVAVQEVEHEADIGVRI